MASTRTLELWGGVECTVNRVGDEYFDQLDRSGHATRVDDLERFAGLGIRAIRYPVLWERVAPGGPGSADWSWPDQRLHRIRELGIRPIVGLLHHGSGPRDTSLVDPSFPARLAEYAAAVARRYPWVDDYTPINEPLTTARFSGLYGLWYPHGRDEATFAAALFNQCRGIVLAMQAIRQVNPGARLVQTDDLGRTYGTPTLRYQADFNNESRWLAWDLLAGRVDEHHALWGWLTGRCGARASDILWFAEHACMPDLMGLNFYVTSDRFLDDRLDGYPVHCHGGNGRHAYVDVEAARVPEVPSADIEPRIAELWERYRRPIAVTEAHLDAGREDQMRWLAGIWAGAERAILAGADVRAVTVWGLLGSFDWNCLLTASPGYYESGAFDVRGRVPRATAVATMMKSLAAGAVPEHPALSGVGWWKRDTRFLRAGQCTADPCSVREAGARRQCRPLLISGARGTLGAAFSRICTERDLDFRLLGREEMDIADRDSIERAIERHAPWAIVNAAGYVKVDEAEGDVERCFRENAVGPSTLAGSCARNAIALVTFSTDLVFDGRREAPYVETDDVAPLSIYGKSKAEAERLVLDRHPQALVVRTSSFFGPWDEHNFIAHALRALRSGESFRAADDVTVSPTYVPDLVNACLDLLIDGESGIWHLTNGCPITWADLALRAAELTHVDARKLHRCRGRHLKLAARRPRYSALVSDRSFAMPPLEDALNRYVAQLSSG